MLRTLGSAMFNRRSPMLKADSRSWTCTDRLNSRPLTTFNLALKTIESPLTVGRDFPKARLSYQDILFIWRCLLHRRKHQRCACLDFSCWTALRMVASNCPVRTSFKKLLQRNARLIKSAFNESWRLHKLHHR